MQMTSLEMRALNIRRTHAHTLMARREIGGLEALSLIVCPTVDVLAASMEAARLAPDVPEPRREHVSHDERPAPARKARGRRAKMKPTMTLDEILAAMS